METGEGTSAPCTRCSNTGIVKTGNNDLPCNCQAGDKALFSVAGADHPVPGRKVRQLLNSAQRTHFRRELKEVLQITSPFASEEEIAKAIAVVDGTVDKIVLGLP